MSRLAATLCRIGDAFCGASPVRWILGTPTLGERMSPEAYVEWEFQNAALSWNYFKPYECLDGKKVLDIGCAHGGKPTYYALHGARHVTAIDNDEARIEAARQFAGRKGAANILFETRDAATLPYPSNHFDLVIYNDSLEHVEEPAASLKAAYRVLREGGTVNIAFPPYGSPWGAHLFAHIRVPWAQFLFPDETLVSLWKTRHDAAGEEGPAYSEDRTLGIHTATTVAEVGHLNRMSIQRFEDIVAMTPFRVLFRSLRTIRNLFGFAAHVPLLREHLVTRVVAVLGKG